MIWARYDKEWDLFDKNHLTFDAPIPTSPSILLVHHIQKVLKKMQSLNSNKKGQAATSASRSLIKQLNYPKIVGNSTKSPKPQDI